MSFFTDAQFGSKVDATCLEFRGNKLIIALMKADIKAFTATTQKETKIWRKFFSDVSKGLAKWETGRPAWRTTNSVYMRHAFLAYGYLRFRSWDEIESKTKEPTIGKDCYFNNIYYHGGPREDLICAIIKHYALKVQEVPVVSATT